jgi:hypothetical protein
MSTVQPIELQICAQCGGGKPTQPMAIIQRYTPDLQQGLIAVVKKKDIEWCARAICSTCWHQPELKGHFIYNNEHLLDILGQAGSMTVKF